MEVTIRLDRDTRQVHLCSTWPEWSRKFERLHGSPKEYQERDGFVTSAFWTLPLEVVSIRRRRRVLTPEQRERATERLRNARSSRRTA